MRRKDIDYLEWILILANKKAHPKTRSLFPLQEKAIKFIKENKGIVEREKLAKELGLNFLEFDEKDKRFGRLMQRFYCVISPLLDFAIQSEKENKTNKTYYRLSVDTFRGKMDAIKKAGDYYFKVGK